MAELSWKPKRKGLTYCSPACGRGCTHAEYLRAKQKADTLAEQLGVNYTSEVFENLGWWSRAVSKCGRITVRPSTGEGGYFHVYLFNDYMTHDHNPRAAVHKAIQVAKESLAKQAATLENLELTAYTV